jgi:hypothetical protein
LVQIELRGVKRGSLSVAQDSAALVTHSAAAGFAFHG